MGSLEPGKLADAVLWRPELFAVRPELVVKAGIAAWGAAGDGNASTMLCEPVRVEAPARRPGGGRGALSLAFLALRDGRRPAHDASARDGGELPRPAGRGHGAQRPHGGGAGAPDLARGHAGRQAGVAAPPIEELAFSGRFLLG